MQLSFLGGAATSPSPLPKSLPATSGPWVAGNGLTLMLPLQMLLLLLKMFLVGSRLKVPWWKVSSVMCEVNIRNDLDTAASLINCCKCMELHTGVFVCNDT